MEASTRAVSSGFLRQALTNLALAPNPALIAGLRALRERGFVASATNRGTIRGQLEEHER